MKKIYFGCSIAGGRDHAHVYQDIVDYIKAAGAHVLSEIFADSSIKAHKGPTPHLTALETWTRDTKWLNEADAVIAEVTTPSLGVGYELGRAEELSKPILALFYKDSDRRLTPMITGNPAIQVFEYSNISQTKQIIAAFIKDLQ